MLYYRVGSTGGRTAIKPPPIFNPPLYPAASPMDGAPFVTQVTDEATTRCAGIVTPTCSIADYLEGVQLAKAGIDATVNTQTGSVAVRPLQRRAPITLVQMEAPSKRVTLERNRRNTPSDVERYITAEELRPLTDNRPIVWLPISTEGSDHVMVNYDHLAPIWDGSC